jgi:FlgD Ig-like domain
MPSAWIVLLVLLALASKPTIGTRPPHGALPDARRAGTPSAGHGLTVANPAEHESQPSGWGGSIGALERNIRITVGIDRARRAAATPRAPSRITVAKTAASRQSVVGASDAGLPERLWFGPPYPNPSRTGVSFQLDLPAASHVRVTVLDVTGRLVYQLDETRPAGRHILSWNGQVRSGDLRPPGVYFTRLFVNGVPAGNHRVVFLH